jgi:DNA-binding response OmpR family regulator
MVKPAVWIVEDDQAVSDALRTLLMHAGYDATALMSGLDAVAQLESFVPDLILLDLNLPDLDGLDVCRAIRALPVYVPVIILTGRNEPVDKLIGLDAGADVYLTKPFDPRELLAQIKAIFRLIERFGQQRDGEDHVRVDELPLSNGALMLWVSQHRVELRGQVLALSPKEYDLLKMLLRHPDRVFGRETLLRAVWGHDFVGDTRTVDVHVQRLRHKIEADPARPQLLLTVRGFGYKLALGADDQTP